MNGLQEDINAIGKEMVKCQEICQGIRRDQACGFFPRGLYLETDHREENERGVVVIGINPGRSQRPERDYYIENGNYAGIVNYWQEHLAENNFYFQEMRDFVNALGRLGPILWTEIIKCETASDINTPDIPLQTYRTCIENYLRNEINHVPDNWLIITAGALAYNAAALSFPDRKILGAPHPRAWGNYFRGMFEQGGVHFNAALNEQLEDFLNAQQPLCRAIEQQNGGYILE